MDMVTPPPLPAHIGQPSQTRVIMLWLALFAIVCAVVGLFLSPSSPEESEPAVAQVEPLSPAAAGETCLKLSQNPSEYLTDKAMQRRQELRQLSCNMALAAQPENTRWQVAVARALPYEQKSRSLAMFREAAALGDAEAYYELYEHHRVWDRGDLDKVPNVSRAEAESALRKAAELGHPYSIRMLANLLERGTTVKRDRAAARVWAERAIANPAKDESRGDLYLVLARLLVTSDNPQERARGLDILEKLIASGRYQYGAKTELANAKRKEDPVRARKLLEEARRDDPGGAIPPLAEMLISGEGGPADPKRAVSLLKSSSDGAFIKGALGQLYLEGKLVPKDVREAVRLIGIAGQWDLDMRQQVVRLLAEYPEVRDSNPKRVLYFAVEAAELGEPGAMAALIDLKMSKNPQFQDRPGACKLIETAAKSGDQAMTERLAECRAN
jgi:TPR repeat protein